MYTLCAQSWALQGQGAQEQEPESGSSSLPAPCTAPGGLGPPLWPPRDQLGRGGRASAAARAAVALRGKGGRWRGTLGAVRGESRVCEAQLLAPAKGTSRSHWDPRPEATAPPTPPRASRGGGGVRKALTSLAAPGQSATPFCSPQGIPWLELGGLGKGRKRTERPLLSPALTPTLHHQLGDLSCKRAPLGRSGEALCRSRGGTDTGDPQCPACQAPAGPREGQVAAGGCTAEAGHTPTGDGPMMG